MNHGTIVKQANFEDMELTYLQTMLKAFANISAEEYSLSEEFWNIKTYKKGSFFNNYKGVCKTAGFIMDGAFRAYHIDEKTEAEKNVFLYSKDQIVVAYKSFIDQVPCNYYTQALTDATIISISYDKLIKLYTLSHGWERFGRLMAEYASKIAVERMESFLFQTPEERYLNMMNNHPEILNTVQLYHISSYLGIQGPSLSRIRKRLCHVNDFNRG